MLIRALPFLSLVFTAALASACGGSSDSDASGGASGTGATGGSGGSGAGAGSGGSSGSGASGGAGGNCAAFKDAPAAEGLTVRYENTTGATLYVIPKNFGCGEEVLFKMTAFNFDDYVLEPGDCNQTCELLQTSGGDCAASCQAPRILRLEAGSSYDYAWSGAVYRAQDMPGACFFDKQPSAASCRQRMTQDPGVYTLSAEATSDCGGCTCDASAGNVFCNTFDQLTAEATGTGSLSFPSDKLVKITFK